MTYSDPSILGARPVATDDRDQVNGAGAPEGAGPGLGDAEDYEPYLPPGPNPFSSVHPQGAPPFDRVPWSGSSVAEGARGDYEAQGVNEGHRVNEGHGAEEAYGAQEGHEARGAREGDEVAEPSGDWGPGGQGQGGHGPAEAGPGGPGRAPPGPGAP